MRRTLLTLGLLIVLASPSLAQIVSPAPGVEIPPEVIQSVNERGASAFQFQNAWIKKTEKIREARERFIASRGFYNRDMIPAAERPQYSVSGAFSIPVFCVKYSNTGADPFPVSTLQTKLFDGPYVPRTLTQFYNEISYGNLSVTGTVYGWTALPNTDAYYAGAGTCDGLCGTAHVGDLITTTLAANDAAVDFGQYDNDGPDGIPNSGDDDGYVDFVAFVQPEEGAECGVSGNIWSHRYSLVGLTGGSYATNDARTGGGVIRVNDYVIQPAFNCGGATVIDIGVFCHEFGHAFGLPDLYDVNGGAQGIGHWGLMGAGNWNLPNNPSHMCAWSKDQLGWVNVVDVDSKPTNYAVDDVEFNNTIYRLGVTNERWRRMTDCKIAGSYSMRCGLLAAEAASRNWGGGSGYGNGWDETVSRDFTYNGSGTVSLTYKYSCDLEPGYDYAYGNITVGGTTTTFATYNGSASGTFIVDLTPYSVRPRGLHGFVPCDLGPGMVGRRRQLRDRVRRVRAGRRVRLRGRRELLHGFRNARRRLGAAGHVAAQRNVPRGEPPATGVRRQRVGRRRSRDLACRSRHHEHGPVGEHRRHDEYAAARSRAGAGGRSRRDGSESQSRERG